MSDPETDHPSQSDVPLDIRIDTIEEQLRNGDDPLRIQKQHIEDFLCPVERDTASGWGTLTTVSPAKSADPTPQKLQ